MPKEWRAVHWMNEVWRTPQNDGGMYKGRRIMDRAYDKDVVPGGRHPRAAAPGSDGFNDGERLRPALDLSGSAGADGRTASSRRAARQPSTWSSLTGCI